MIIKKSVLTVAVASAALAMSAAATAAGDSFFNGEGAGFVVGAQGGYADTHWDDFSGNPGERSLVKDTGFTARGFLGFDFNKYLGLEAGYTYLPKVTVTGDDSSEIKNYAVDLLAKLSVPVTNVFSVYAKAGGSYLDSKLEIEGTDSRTNSHIGPAFGVGAAYEVVPNLAIDLSWMRFSGQTSQSNTPDTDHFYGDRQPSPDVVLLGVSYKFPVNYS